MNIFKSSYIITLFVFSCFSLSSCEKLFNKAPEISDQVFSVPENSPEGTIIGQVEVSDKSGQDIGFWIIDGNEDGIFSIDALKGTLLVIKSEFLDYEYVRSFDLLVRARGEFGKHTDAVITINLEDVLEMEGVVLYMPFDGNLNDLSPNSNNGIDHTTGVYITGISGQAKEFNGISDYVQLTNTLNNSKGLSFSFWIKTYGVNGTENNGVIIGKYSMSSYNRCFLINSFGLKTEASRADNFVSANFYSQYYYDSFDHDYVKSSLIASDLTIYPNPSLWTIISPKGLTLNTWTHCVVNMAPAYLEVYINNTLCVKKKREHFSYEETSQVPTLIGNCLNGGDGTNNHFHGALDELRVFNRSLSAPEISNLYNQH